MHSHGIPSASLSNACGHAHAVSGAFDGRLAKQGQGALAQAPLETQAMAKGLDLGSICDSQAHGHGNHRSKELKSNAGWQPLHSDWPGVNHSVEAPHVGAEMPGSPWLAPKPATGQLVAKDWGYEMPSPFGSSKPASTHLSYFEMPSPFVSSKHASTRLSHFEMPKLGFLRAQPGLAAAWDVDVPGVAADFTGQAHTQLGPSHAAQHTPEASPHVGHHQQQKQQTGIGRIPTAVGRTQMAVESHHAVRAPATASNTRRQNSTAVLIPSSAECASDSAAIKHGGAAAGVATKQPGRPVATASQESPMPNAWDSSEPTHHAGPQERTANPVQGSTASPMMSDDGSEGKAHRLQNTRVDASTNADHGDRLPQRPCALHSSRSWQVSTPEPAPMPLPQHAQPSAAPLATTHKLIGANRNRPGASQSEMTCKAARSDEIQTGSHQQGKDHHAALLAGSSIPSTSPACPSDNAAVHAVSELDAADRPDCFPVKTRPAHIKPGLHGQVLLEHHDPGLSKQSELIRLSTGVDTPAWRIHAHDFHSMSEAGCLRASAPAALPASAHDFHDRISSAKEESRITAHDEHVRTSDGLQREGSNVTPSDRLRHVFPVFPTRIRVNPLFNDEAMPVAGSEHMHHGGNSTDAMDVDDLSPLQSHVDMGLAKAEHSLGPLASGQDSAQQSVPRFSGSGMVQPGPKRIALGLEQLISGSTHFHLQGARRHSEPLPMQSDPPSQACASLERVLICQEGTQRMHRNLPFAPRAASPQANAGHATFGHDPQMQAGVDIHSLPLRDHALNGSLQAGNNARHQAPLQIPQQNDPGHLTMALRAEHPPLQPAPNLIEQPPHAADAHARGEGEAEAVPHVPVQNAREAHSRGASSVTMSSSAAASALSSRQSSSSAVAWPGWAEIQAQCSASADLAAAFGSMSSSRPLGNPMSDADRNGVNGTQVHGANAHGVAAGRYFAVGMQLGRPNAQAACNGKFASSMPLPLSLPDGLSPFHLERPSPGWGMHSALLVAPHPLESLPSRAGHGLVSGQPGQLQLPQQLPDCGTLQRTNSFNSRMRTWFLKRKA